jgi:hypothetical protein
MNNYDCRFICSYILASCYIGNIKNKSGDYEKIKQKQFFHFQHNTTNQHHHSMISQGVYIYYLIMTKFINEGHEVDREHYFSIE